MKKEIFQEYELEAYLGDYIDDYDVDAIIKEVTEIDARGNIVWKDMDEDEFWSIVEAHDISADA